ncbi:MAG: peptide MFS transporter [Candidatus Andeanibacterium colombiense]|uniref:Peptide MFS transporter n=1 Tax=Candidatus Andeanibacterium colombiense TaxID=3121345 RepID=A0AAJ6BP72_9SPHN|nr:MAG: peptide MFS transporter [Sphingomonadaceae bacterium]
MTATEVTPELAIIDRNDRAFLGHPKGLGYLAFTEAWERFSFYGMRALLPLYMIHFLFQAEQVSKIAGIETLRKLFGGLQGEPFAIAIAGAYAAGVYLTPIFGGLLADQVLGKRRTVLLGAVTMALGHFLMAFNVTFVLALVCLVLGAGMFKGNISSQVGSLYKPEDLRRADAFQIFYLGINAGVIASPLVIGTLGEKVGWHWGFGAAGIGMLLGLAIYIAGQKYLPKEHFDVPGRTAAKDRPTMEPMNRRDWLAVLAALLLIPIIALGQVPNDQIFGAYIVWADQQFDLVFFGIRLPTTWLVTLDAIVSVAFLAGVALFYRWYGKRWKEPDELSKMIIGSAISVFGVGCLYMAALTQPEGGKIGMFWPVMFHVVNSIAFAHILPVGLALYARLAPKQLNSTVIAFYFIGFFVDGAMTGYVGTWYGSIPTTSFWAIHMGFSAVCGGALLLFKLFLAKPLMGGGKPEDLALA